MAIKPQISDRYIYAVKGILLVCCRWKKTFELYWHRCMPSDQATAFFGRDSWALPPPSLAPVSYQKFPITPSIKDKCNTFRSSRRRMMNCSVFIRERLFIIFELALSLDDNLCPRQGGTSEIPVREKSVDRIKKACHLAPPFLTPPCVTPFVPRYYRVRHFFFFDLYGHFWPFWPLHTFFQDVTRLQSHDHLFPQGFL